MKKEILIAILVGLVMGVFITYGVYLSRQAGEETQTTATSEELEVVEPSPDPDKNGKITIYNPEDEAITAVQTTQVTGKTAPSAFVVIFVNDEPIITQADETGNFSKEVSLETLANVIKVHAVNEDGEHYTAQRTIVVYADPLVTEAEADQEGSEDSENDSENESSLEEAN